MNSTKWTPKFEIITIKKYDMLEKLKYPIGKLSIPSQITSTEINEWILTIERFPEKLENLVKNLSEQQLDTPYREGGWTVRQLIHHCADSHLNSYIRFKWSLTEDKPVIKAYDQDLWAELSDGKTAPILLSLNHLNSLHAKWVYLLKGLTHKDFQKTFIHPESGKEVSLKTNLAIYAWHCDHHFAHIYNLMERNHWLD